MVSSLLCHPSRQTGVLKLTKKVRLCRLYNNKIMIVLTEITNTETFAFIADLVFNFLGCKVLFTHRKDNRNG